MTKADLVEEVIRVADLSKKDAEIVVNTVFEQIIEALKGDDKIELRGFGSFRVRRRRSRQGRNPKTGDRVDVPSKRIPYFKPDHGPSWTSTTSPPSTTTTIDVSSTLSVKLIYRLDSCTSRRGVSTSAWRALRRRSCCLLVSFRTA